MATGASITGVFWDDTIAYCWASVLEFSSNSPNETQLLDVLTSLVNECHNSSKMQLVIDLRFPVHWNSGTQPQVLPRLCQKFHSVLIICDCDKGVDQVFDTSQLPGITTRFDILTVPTYWLLRPNDTSVTLALHIHQFSKNSIQSYAQYSPLQSELTKRVEKLICDGTEELVKRCWIPAPEGQAVLRSTRLTGPGVFDAKLILGDPFAFSWICCLLATRVLTCTRSALPHAGIELRGKPLRGEFRILACTQNGVAISAGVLRACDILNQDDEAPRIAGIDVIDTFGPPQRYIEQYSYASSEPILSYLYIGDFAIAGTELKLAQLHAFHSSTKLLKAFAIGSLQRPSSDQQASNGLDLDTLILLSKLPLTDRNGDPIVLKYTFGDATETLPHE